VRTASELVDATETLRRVLHHYEAVIADLIARVERGGEMVEAIVGVNAATVRTEVTKAMEAFEAARHRVRVAMVAAALDQGASASEVARALGFSRQLASRLVAEIEDA
jgi:phage terminase large subunit-like protein